MMVIKSASVYVLHSDFMTLKWKISLLNFLEHILF